MVTVLSWVVFGVICLWAIAIFLIPFFLKDKSRSLEPVDQETVLIETIFSEGDPRRRLALVREFVRIGSQQKLSELLSRYLESEDYELLDLLITHVNMGMPGASSSMVFSCAVGAAGGVQAQRLSELTILNLQGDSRNRIVTQLIQFQNSPGHTPTPEQRDRAGALFEKLLHLRPILTLEREAK